MFPPRRCINLLLASFGLLLSGCGTTTAIQREPSHETSAPRKNLAFESITVQVRTEVAGTESEAKVLENHLREQFIAKNKKVIESDADAQMVVVIKHLKKVSRGARLLWGSLAGQAEIRGDVNMTLRKSEPVHFILDTEAKGASSAGDWFTGYGGSTEELLERAAAAIAAEVL